MKSTMKGTTLKREVYIGMVPEGEYIGMWDGGQITFSVGDYKYFAEVPTRIRGKVRCLVTIADRKLTVDTSK